MIIKSSNIINVPNIEVGKIVKLEFAFHDGVMTFPRALIKSINNDEIEFEPLVDCILTQN